jgi:PAS domain S-box-containing protein
MRAAHMNGLAIPLLPALFRSSVVGVSVIDANMRFSAINKALAAMNGIPVHRHIGQSMRQILGNAATKVESAVQRVLQTGKLVSNLELTAELPARTGIGYWVESFFPVIDCEGRTSHVVAFVLEITEHQNIQRSLKKVVKNLANASNALKLSSGDEQRTGEARRVSNHLNGRLTHWVENCITEVQNIHLAARRSPYVVVPQVRNRAIIDYRVSDHAKQIDFASDPRGRTTPLTGRERSVLELLVKSNSNKEIATALGISVRTAETYRARLMSKLNVHSVVNLVRYAIRNGIIEP